MSETGGMRWGLGMRDKEIVKEKGDRGTER